MNSSKCGRCPGSFIEKRKTELLDKLQKEIIVNEKYKEHEKKIKNSGQFREELLKIDGKIIGKLFIKIKEYTDEVVFSMVTIHELPRGKVNNNKGAVFDTYAKAYAYKLNKNYEMTRQSKEYSKMMHNTPKDNVKNCLHMNVEFM